MSCDKVSYDEYKDAINAIIGISSKNKKKFRAYKCTFCTKFHITTINKRTLFNIKKSEKYPLKIDDAKKSKKFQNPNVSNMPKATVIPLATEKIISTDMARLLKGKIDAMNRTQNNQNP